MARKSPRNIEEYRLACEKEAARIGFPDLLDDTDPYDVGGQISEGFDRHESPASLIGTLFAEDLAREELDGQQLDQSLEEEPTSEEYE